MIGEYIAPSIKVIKNAIEYSDDLLLVVNSAPKSLWQSSGIDDYDSHDESIRNSREMSLAYGLEKPKIFFQLSQDIYTMAKDYAKENGFMFSHMEGVNLLEYQPNEGFFDRHADSGPNFPRSMSALLYLNDVEEGGGTWFDKFGIMIKPEKGKLVLFPANYPYSHQALPPISGIKYVVVTWFGEQIDRNVFERYYP